MDQRDDIETDHTATRTRPIVWVLRGMLTLCGGMMALVILSEPRVTASIQASVANFSGMFATESSVARLDTEVAPSVPVIPQAAPQPKPAVQTEAPKVLSMPTSRIPVRRGNIGYED